MKIGVAITTFGAIDPIVYHNHLSVLLHWKTLFDLSVYHIQDTQQESSLNTMVEAAMNDKCDFIFFMEHDNIYQKTTLPDLLKHDLDVVTGHYTFRNWPFSPIPLLRHDNGLLYRYEFVAGDPTVPALHEITIGCFGCCLVKMHVMRDLFNKRLIFRREYNKKDEATLTPDCVFFADLAKEGYKSFVDGHVEIGHLGQRLVITPTNFRIYREFMQLLNPEIVAPHERLPQDKAEEIINFLLEKHHD